MSDLTLTITLTDAGMAAVAAAHGQGLQAKITHVAVGDLGYAPGAGVTALHNERARVALTAGGVIAPRQVLLQGMIPAGGQEFFIRELGYFLEDGTLLGVWSDPVTPLGWIGGATPWFFKLSFAWSALPVDAITVIIADDAGQAGMALDLTRLEGKVRHTVETGGGIAWGDLDETQLTTAIITMIGHHAPAPPVATTAVQGITRLATRPEAVAGAREDIAVTPKGMSDALAAVPPSSVGKHTYSVAAGAILPRVTGGAEPSSVEGATNKGNVRTLLFDAAVIEYGNHVWLPPKSWDRGAITVQFVWEHPAAAANYGVVWGAQAVAFGDGDVMDAAWGALVTVADMGGVAATAYVTAESGAVAVAGNPQAGDAVLIQVCRVATDAINDTLAVDAGLIGIRIHYTTAAATDA